MAERIPAQSRPGLPPLPALVKYPASMFNDDDMRTHAAGRGLVELRNGAIVQLTCWKRPRPPKADGTPRSHRNDARVRAQVRGSVGTVKCRDVVSLCIPDTIEDAP